MSLAAYQDNAASTAETACNQDLSDAIPLSPAFTRAQVIPLGILTSAEVVDATQAANPYTDLARTALEQVLSTGESPRRVRVGHILRATFGPVEIPRADRHLFYEAFNGQPGVEFEGEGWYRVTRVVTAEASSLEASHPEAEPNLEVLARQVVDQIKPGWPFEDKVFIGAARRLGGTLSLTQIAELLSFVISDHRIIALEDGRFNRREEEVRVTPRDVLAEQPEVLSEVVVRRGTLDGMIKVALPKSSRRKPQSHRKHSGWRRVGYIDGYGDV